MNVQQLIEAFTHRCHVEPFSERKITASVCVILGGPDTAPALCFIKRSERTSDPWSGQMAFPGGRVAPTDVNAHAAGIRETSEEVGLDLTSYRYLGALPPIRITHRGKSLLGWLQPFVHLCSPNLPALRLQPSEVAAGLWIPVTHLTDPANRTSVTLAENTHQLLFPGISYCGEIIWGLTYKVLNSILNLTDLETVQPDR